MGVDLRDKITTNTFLQLLKVQIVSTIISLMGNIIDGVVISRFLGATNMSAYGLGCPVVIVMVAFSFVLSAGSQAFCGKHLGRGETGEVNKIMNKVIFFGLLVAVLFNIVLFFCSKSIALLLGGNEETLVPCAEYLRGFSFSAYGMILSPVLISFLQMDRDGRRVMFSSIMLVISCTTLDFLNVLVLKFGMVGMGLTTAVSYGVSVVILLTHFLKKKKTLSLSFKLFKLKGVGEIIKVGFPAATYHLTNFVKVLSTNLIAISVGGAAGIFSCTVLNSVNNIIVGFVNGVGLTALLVCSVIVGEGNRRSLHHTLKFIFRVGAIIGISLGVVLFVISGPVISNLYCTGDSVTYKENVISMARFFAISITFTTINTIFINYFQSMKKLVLANAICVFDNAIYLVGAMLVLSKVLGINGVWLSFTCAEILSTITILIIAWVKNKKIPKSIHDLMLVPDDFGVDSDHRVNITISKKEEISQIYDKIADFCSEKNIEPEKTMAVVHCMEELSLLAIVNNTKKKRIYVDIYLTFKDGILKLRMRDNGTPIDVSLLPDNLEMKIVYGMAKEVNYNVVLGLNVFSVII